MQCVICNNQAREIPTGADRQEISCNYCGEYSVSGSLDIESAFEDKSNFYKVSSWIREQNDEFNKPPYIDGEMFEKILNMRDKKIKEKFDLMMVYLSTLPKYEHLNEKILVKCWLKDTNELDILIQKAKDSYFIEAEFIDALSGYYYPTLKCLTFDGLQYLEELENPNKNSKKIFVAFNFDEPLTSIFNTNLKEAIESEGFEYVVVNQDNVEYNKSINDEIIVKLKTSRIVIADFTNHRNSVYFEAGYAMGMDIPIIWTCQIGHENKMSFDTRQFPHIVWENKDDLVKQIINRIKRIL